MIFKRENYVKFSILLIFLFLFSSFSFSLFGTNPDKLIKKLAPKYQKWWDMVYWIITPQEKKIFLQLKNDRERDAFIDAFWKHRDPTPGTPKNEYKEEIERRFRYVNRYFRTLSPRAPWKTDMGRIYMILGEPISRDHFVMKNDVYPCEVWCYYGNPQYGLPAHFCLVFFKRRGVGEYELYNPVIDGPAALINTSDMLDVTNYEKMYEKLRDLEPTLAPYSLSIIPGEIPTNYSPDIRTLIYFKNIAQYPYKNVDTTYARNFLKYKGKVDARYSSNFIKSNFSYALTYDPDFGIYFFNYLMTLRNLSLGSYNDKPYVNFELYGTIKDLKSGKEIFHYAKKFPISFTKSQLKSIKAGGFGLSDIIPIVPGCYKIEILLKNTVSFEFSYIERELKVPDVKSNPFISSIISGYDVVNDNSLSIKPFKVGNILLKTNTKNAIGTRERMYILFQLANISKDLKNEGFLHLIYDKKNVDKYEYLKEEKIPLSEFTGNINPFFLKSIKPEEIEAGKYKLEVALREGSKVFDRKVFYFSISPKSKISEPTLFYKTLPFKNRFVLYYFYGEELKNCGDFESAIQFAKKGIEMNPNFSPLYRLVLEAYIGEKNLIDARKFIEEIPPSMLDSKLCFNIGLVYELSSNYDRAIFYYKKSLDFNDRNFASLRNLGLLLYKMGKRDEGISYIKRALEIKPDQKDLKKIVEKSKDSKN